MGTASWRIISRITGSCHYYNLLHFKEIRNVLSPLLSYISMQDFFKNTREVLEKHELQENASHTSRVFLKNSKCLCNSTMYEEQVFISFIKCIMNCTLVLMT